MEGRDVEVASFVSICDRRPHENPFSTDSASSCTHDMHTKQTLFIVHD